MEVAMLNRVPTVEAGRDCDGRDDLMVWGVLPLAIKVSSQDTNGRFMIFEHAGMQKGGPPRHVHYDQDEWFYVARGVYAFEVGQARCQAGVGATVFAPRGVPHCLACIGEEPGTLLVVVAPVNGFEDFILDATRYSTIPTWQEMEYAFATHGMKLVGPPLAIDAV